MESILLCGFQCNSQHLRAAAEAQRFLAGEATADHHHRSISLEDALIETPAVAARNEDRANHRHADLPAVDMAAQHQADAVALAPVEIIRRV